MRTEVTRGGWWGAVGLLAWGPWVVVRGLARLVLAVWWWAARGRRRLPVAVAAVALCGAAVWLPRLGALLTVALLLVAVALGWRDGRRGRGRGRCAGDPGCGEVAGFGRRPRRRGRPATEVAVGGDGAAPWPVGVVAQRFVCAPGEMVLGCTDPTSADRRVPAVGEHGPLEVAPLVWRTGPRATEPHLLVVGSPGAGGSGLLRSVALQALAGGAAVLVDGGGTGGFGCFAGRVGVWGVESTPAGAVAGLAWAARETERRLLLDAADRRAEQPLWLVVDRPVLLAHRAWAAGAGDPLGWLDVPLRFGREALVTVVLAEQVGVWEALGAGALECVRARVALGELTVEQVARVVGGTPPRGAVPGAGAGFARLGAGPVSRLRVPAAPDPWDETALAAQRHAVWRLLPPSLAGFGTVAEVERVVETEQLAGEATGEVAYEAGPGWAAGGVEAMFGGPVDEEPGGTFGDPAGGTSGGTFGGTFVERE
ncbi:hypothetical protein [Streptomyces chisholmiae]|uniref:hypothetical protein n=1 Tax=Streptomyces chisholmiae TaxID=3075540 RepID=UPI002889F5A9|nr:hypothetical protein [Streptomyces sp. DSM 44915]